MKSCLWLSCWLRNAQWYCEWGKSDKAFIYFCIMLPILYWGDNCLICRWFLLCSYTFFSVLGCLKKSGELIYQMVNSFICFCIHVILEGVNFCVVVSGLWSWNGSCAHQTSNEAAASAEYICPTSYFSFLVNAVGEERIGSESQVLLGCIDTNYRGALWSKVTVSLYWSNSEQHPAPNLCIDLGREFQKLSELCRSMITVWNQWPLCTCVYLK